MARYTEAKCRICRREGAKLFLKGDRCYTDKCAYERRPYAPGQHAQTEGRGRRRVDLDVVVIFGGQVAGTEVDLQLSGGGGAAAVVHGTRKVAVQQIDAVEVRGIGDSGDFRGHVASVEELADLVLAKGFVLPGLDCGGCGRKSCGALGADILAGRASPEECVSAHPPLSVSIGDRPLSVNPFVARVLASGIRGLLTELKGYGPGPLTIRIG